MAESVKGTVIEKSYRPPPGAPARYWCYLLVESEGGERVSVRLHQKRHEEITIGDRVRFDKPWRKGKAVKGIQRLA